MDRFKTIRVSKGQSIVFMAILLLVLIAFAGLSIDTGKAFQQQRTIQAGANGGSIAGMNMVVLKRNDTEIQAAINQSMTDNQVKRIQQIVGENTAWGSDLDTTYYKAVYLDIDGNYLNDVGQYGNSTIPAMNDTPAVYVRVTTFEPVSTTFAKVVGRDRFNVSAQGLAGLSNCTLGVMPVTFHTSELNNNILPNISPVQPLPSRYWDESASAIISAHPESVFEVDASPTVGNFAWIQWTPSSSGANDFRDAWTGSGTLGDGFVEYEPPITVPDYDISMGQINGILESKDWMNSATGNMATIGPILNEHITNKTKFMFPMHDYQTNTGTNKTYRMAQLVKVRLLEYSLTPANSRYFKFALIEKDAKCSGPATPPPVTSDKAELEVVIKENLIKNIYPPEGYDITLVVDVSQSLKYCWDANVIGPNAACNGDNTRRIDYAKQFIDGFANTMLAPGSQSRISMVLFGLYERRKNVAKLVVPYTAASDAAPEMNPGDPGVFLDAINALRDRDMAGNTATAQGLAEAYQLVSSSNTRKLPVVILITDGLTNVFMGGNLDGLVNAYNTNPTFCGIDANGINDPFIQMTCPTAGQTAQYGSQPPIMSAIQQSNTIRSYNPDIQIYAVVVGSPPDALTAEERYLDKIAGRTFMANSPDDLDALAFSNMVSENCQTVPLPSRLASNATVTLIDSGGDTQTFYTDANGKFTAQLTAGIYSMSVAHRGVLSPGESPPIARDYTELSEHGSTERTGFVNVTLVEGQKVIYSTVDRPLGLFVDSNNPHSCTHP